MIEPTATNATLQRTAGLAFVTLLAGTGTLVCCVLPALMVALGAGATLAAIVTNVPQLIWMSEHKAWVFGSASVLLLVSGAMLWRARSLPCPVDFDVARACSSLRRVSLALWVVALGSTTIGAFFAFVLPLL